MVTMGLFAPLPLALMIPFMAGQSFAMGEAFGKGFQYGKRRISAMDNAQFNKMSAKDHFLETTADIKSMIPEMKQAMSNFAFLQQDIIKELLGYIKETTGTIIEEIHDTGTDASQKAVDGIRAIAGLPPIYAKLASPAGVNALLHFWSVTGTAISNLGPSAFGNLLYKLLKEIFGVNPPASTISWIIDYYKGTKTDDGGLIGPPPPPEGITPPEDELEFTKDTRHEDSNLPAVRAPKSIITQFNKLNQEARAFKTVMLNWLSGRKVKTLRSTPWWFKYQDVMRKMLVLWQKYDLEGKVNSSYYDYHTPLATHH